MNKIELNKKAKDIFNNKPTEDTLYCIEDGNFWYASNKVSASIYSRKLGLELIEIKKKDLEVPVKVKAPAKTKAKATTKKKKSIKK